MSQFIFVDEDEIKEKEQLEQDLEYYKKAFMILDDSIDKLKDAFLGPDWYIVDPMCTLQADEFIIDEIIKKFAPKKKEKKFSIFKRK